MPLTALALKAEIQNDPTALGYAAPFAAGDDSAVAALLNAVGAGAAYSIFKNSIPIVDLVKNIASAEFPSLTALKLQQLQLLFAGSATMDATDANTRAIVQGVFAGLTSTLANFAILSKRQGSRAEVLFGIGAAVTPLDVAAARRA